MVFTIEPMVNAGNPNDTQWPDNWTVVTTDGKRSAQFEHTLLVTEDGMEILTASPKYYDTSKPVMEMLPFDRAMFQRNWVVCLQTLQSRYRFRNRWASLSSPSASGSTFPFSQVCFVRRLRGMLLSTSQWGLERGPGRFLYMRSCGCMPRISLAWLCMLLCVGCVCGS